MLCSSVGIRLLLRPDTGAVRRPLLGDPLLHGPRRDPLEPLKALLRGSPIPRRGEGKLIFRSPDPNYGHDGIFQVVCVSLTYTWTFRMSRHLGGFPQAATLPPLPFGSAPPTALYSPMSSPVGRPPRSRRSRRRRPSCRPPSPSSISLSIRCARHMRNIQSLVADVCDSCLP